MEKVQFRVRLLTKREREISSFIHKGGQQELDLAIEKAKYEAGDKLSHIKIKPIYEGDEGYITD